MGRIYVDRETGKIERTDLYLVRLTLADGTVYEGLEPRRLFPLTNGSSYISLLDEREREIAMVRDMRALDADSAAALDACFSEYYMIPKILRVISCEDKFGVLRWTVETDRGEVVFQIRSRHSDIKHFQGSNRVIIRDSNDNRYEIPDCTAMDKRSTHLLFAYL
ncbi:MAG: DUF1854 domain-containing protein [Clostridia bacterium]|nr:DUF1854 domain-containing protein [Clostridia bacterium]